MPSTNKTRKFNLSQFIGTDKVKMQDFNEDFEKIENILLTFIKSVSQTENRLNFTKGDDTSFTVNLPEIRNAGSGERGVTTFNEIKAKALEKMQEFGIGVNSASSIDIDRYLPTGIYIINNGNSRINGKTTAVLNIQYNNDWGVQLGLVEMVPPKLFIRVKQNGNWQAWREIPDIDKVKELIKESLGTIVSENGAMDIRYHNNSLEVKVDNHWKTVYRNKTYSNINGVNSIKVVPANRKIKIKYTDTDSEKWRGTLVLMKEGSFSASASDGQVVSTSMIRNQFKSNYLEIGNLTNGTEYYFTIMSFDDENSYSLLETNKFKATPEAYVTYTVVIDENNSNPKTAVSYSDNATGNRPGWENWKDKSIFRDIKPCVINTGEIKYYLQRDNRTLKENGERAELENGDNIMIEFPKVFWRFKRSGNTLSVSITNNPEPPQPNEWVDYAFMNYLTKEKKEKLYIKAQLEELNINIENIKSELEKRINETPVNLQLNTFKEKYPKEEFEILGFYQLTLIQILYLIIFKDLDSVKNLGKGNVKQTLYLSYEIERYNGEYIPRRWKSPVEIDETYYNNEEITSAAILIPKIEKNLMDTESFVSKNSSKNANVFLGIENIISRIPIVIGDIKKTSATNVRIESTNTNLETLQHRALYMTKAKGNNESGFFVENKVNSTQSSNARSNSYYCSLSKFLEFNLYDNGGCEIMMNYALERFEGNGLFSLNTSEIASVKNRKKHIYIGYSARMIMFK